MVLLDKKSYESYWSFSSLSVLKYSGFDKEAGALIKCTSQNYPDCDIYDIYNKNVGENVIHSFVALCRREYEQSGYEKCEIAQLWAGTEIK